ncbi:uncharacterized protein LOC131670460 isoform X2 [Phymastichus coffea]|uniref:uncharacterized protein LOC131670460 isoform X2 n=1 Tax=Phymastichus coffea TaxID=108790 RepID=UPI00273ACD63|nr:uncharacterized protein LOC131670460 isoform X2 [Phymastichus coffea]
MRSKPSASSIYWDSYESGSGSSGSAASRNYVDPWDLENYAYLRRHSVAASAAGTSPRPLSQPTIRAGDDYGSRSSYHSPVESDYWYAPAIREPGYDAPASVEEIYFRPQPAPRTPSCCYHRQPIYEDEMSHYAAPIPLYTRLSELEHEELRTREMIRRRSQATSRSRNYLREECYYHRKPNEMLMEAPSLMMEEDELLLDEVEAVGYREPSHYSNKTSHITLNAYGHLKIDYTNSWNSLHRKIISK